MAELPAPSEGFVLTHFIVSADVPRSAAQENRRSSWSPRAVAAAPETSPSGWEREVESTASSALSEGNGR